MYITKDSINNVRYISSSRLKLVSKGSMKIRKLSDSACRVLGKKEEIDTLLKTAPTSDYMRIRSA